MRNKKELLTLISKGFNELAEMKALKMDKEIMQGQKRLIKQYVKELILVKKLKL